VIGEALRRPDAADVREVTGFAIGGIPPLGHRTPLITLMDAALLDYDLVWAAAGTPDAVFPVAPDQLAAAAEARIIALA
jgi:prolyl-tRNA editing enzyme YbaK/EbsC (Cys-tRNA(Pro) deacylase)